VLSTSCFHEGDVDIRLNYTYRETISPHKGIRGSFLLGNLTPTNCITKLHLWISIAFVLSEEWC
jgi:hypothetical protein